MKNAPVETRHKERATDFTLMPYSACKEAIAQSLANNEQLRCDLQAARAENADLTNRLAAINGIALHNGWASGTAFHKQVADFASGHTQGEAVTPSPCPECPECTLKDEAMVTMHGALVMWNERYKAVPEWRLRPTSDHPSFVQAVLATRSAIALADRFITPPADPVDLVWTFDEKHLETREIPRPPGLSNAAWYNFARDVTAALAELKSRLPLGGAK